MSAFTQRSYLTVPVLAREHRWRQELLSFGTVLALIWSADELDVVSQQLLY